MAKCYLCDSGEDVMMTVAAPQCRGCRRDFLQNMPSLSADDLARLWKVDAVNVAPDRPLTFFRSTSAATWTLKPCVTTSDSTG